KALVHQESEEKFFRDDNFREDNNEYSANSIPSIAKSATHDEAELLNTGIEDCIAVPLEKEEKLQPKYTETMSEIQVPLNVTETVTKILRNDRMEDDNYSYITFDFAGQPVYSATHPVFFSSKAIYILVYSLEDKLDDQAHPIYKEGCYEKKTRRPLSHDKHGSHRILVVLCTISVPSNKNTMALLTPMEISTATVIFNLFSWLAPMQTNPSIVITQQILLKKFFIAWEEKPTQTASV
ncbi:hypothetical protein QZH41_010688, partial [Actinostola sp. cb2023]